MSSSAVPRDYRVPIFTLATLCTALVFGCATSGVGRIELPTRVQVPQRCAVIFFVDGMDRTTFQRMAEQGRLPNMSKYFVDGGVGVRRAVAAMPAITYCNAVSLITGLFPGHHGIMGNEWFDRRTLQYREYIHADSYRSVNKHFAAPTIYEILGDCFTVSIQGHTRRGAQRVYDNVIPTGIDWYTRNYSATDRRTRFGLDWVIRDALREGRWPTLMTYYFPGVDMTGHRFGVQSQQYADALRTADESIGRICRTIRKSALRDRTYFVLMTDHGHVAVPPDNYFNVNAWLESFGYRVHSGRMRLKYYTDRLRLLRGVDVVVVNGDSRRCALHLRGANGWSNPVPDEQTLALLERSRLLLEPAIALAVTRAADGTVHVRSRTGHAKVTRRIEGSQKLYRVDNLDGDPLGLQEDAELQSFAAAGWHDSRSWLAASVKARYPDFVPQVVEMMDTPRAGQVVLFADDNWAFGRDASAHGSCAARDMIVPLYFSGPDLARDATIPYARLVDIMPTVLDLLGESARLADINPIDGQSIAAQLRAAQ